MHCFLRKKWYAGKNIVRRFIMHATSNNSNDGDIVCVMRRIMMGLCAASFARDNEESRYIQIVAKKFRERFTTLPVNKQEQMLESLQEVSGIIKEIENE